MKKILYLLFVLAVTGCSKEPVENNYYTVCEYISGYMQAAPGGRYELLRHTDGSADIVCTDIAAATRKTLGGDTAVEIAHDVVTGIFARDGYLYHYFNGAPPGMEEDVAAVLYQYDTNGNLLQVCKIGADVELDMNSAVVSDGRCLYFSGREAVCENGKPAERISHIFAIDQKNMEIKKVYTPHQATVDIISGYKGSLVAEFEYPGKDKNGDVQFRSRVELLDMKTLERKPLFTTTNLWYNLCEGKLYNPYDVDGGIKIYDLENRKETTVILTDDTEMLKNGHISVNFITDRYVFLSVEYYGNMLTENYIYDFETDGLSPAPDFCGMPCLYPEDSGYYIVQTGEQKVSVSEGFYSVNDIYYSLITPDDYHNGNENLMPIKNEIEYR